MADLELIGVPFDGYGRHGNQALAASALRAAGLANAFAAHRIVADADLPALPSPTPTRGVLTSLINEPALVAMTAALNQRVGAALRTNHTPIVFGGDCSMLLGIVSGLRDHAPPTGVVFVDGHEDTMPLDVSEDGEAANTEIGLLLGLTGRSLRGPLSDAVPALRYEQLAVLGPRDDAWRRQFNVGSLRDVGVWLAALSDVSADPAASGAAAVRHVAAATDQWWLHVDLDVLDPEQFSAQGLPGVPDEPGGLTWDELTSATVAALGEGGCVGLSVAIYDPEQDPSGSDARRIVDWLAALAPHL